MSITTLLEQYLPLFKRILDFMLAEPLLSVSVIFSIISYLIYKVIGLFR